jgi:hypothetical protein
LRFVAITFCSPDRAKRNPGTPSPRFAPLYAGYKIERAPLRAYLRQLNAPVVVAMIAMGMMQVPLHQIVDMVAMGDRLVPAVRAVRVSAPCFRRAAGRIGRVDSDDMLVNVIAMHVVHMAIMQIVDVALVADGGVPAIRAVLVSVIRMVLLVAIGHGVLLLC